MFDQVQQESGQAHAGYTPAVESVGAEPSVVVPVEVTDPGEAEAQLRRKCDRLRIEWLDETPEEVDGAASSLLSADDAIRLRLVPIVDDETDGVLVVMRDPLDLAALDEASVLMGKPVRRKGLSADPFRKLIETQYGTTAARMAERLAGEAEDEDSLDSNIEAIEADDLHRMAEQPTLINLVNLIILEAIKSRASDVHIEPFERELKIKYRIDGILHEQTPPPKHLQPAIISRIKIMAAMNIAERFVPQDGHITLRFEGRKVDLRVSTVPTLYGESVVLRILDKSTLPLELAELGMIGSDISVMQRLLAQPHGMILVTGPTGSGKTTTLYAALQMLYSPEQKIITIEDPVEYELPGVNQIQVNPKRGVTFATGLRHILRQDPDVIMVGEIRDGDTAEIAIRSALTGHLVFSTVHTNDAASAITRLIDMEIEPFLVASVIEGILAQRLGRRVCSECRQSVPIDEAVSHRLRPDELALFDGQCWRGAGCDRCRESGTQGRIGFFEILAITGRMRAAVTDGKSTREILALADESHTTMRVDGLRKAAEGRTTIEEVLRATQDAEDDR
ncbi:MAG: type II/IV secretion system protein [Planctomycetes bacterium]|nr:type II/IV secretion system protein [Planctomycetota bacterium]NOG55767.1 type II/IV secretion system protein [Planctomycetota bacterium]